MVTIMNYSFKYKLAAFSLLAAAQLFISMKLYAVGLKGYFIIGQSTNVKIEDKHVVYIDVKKDFTTDDGQLLFRSQVPTTVVNLTSDTGNTISLAPRINNVYNLRYSNSNPSDQLPHHSGSCHNDGGQGNTSGFTLNFTQNGTCIYNNSRGADTISFNEIHFGRSTANSYWNIVSPITVPGIYRGSITYNLGPGKEFDMGPEAVYSTDRIEVPIEVHVASEPLKVTFPPGAERAILAPQNGWSSWIGRGVSPTRIYRDIPFTVSSQGWVSVRLTDCTHITTRACQISDGNGGLATISVKMTLPEPWKNLNNTELIYPSNPDYVTLTRYFSGLSPATSRGKLTVEVSDAELNKLLASPGSEWSGNIAVIFEPLIDE